MSKEDCFIEYVAVRLDGVSAAQNKMTTAEPYKMYNSDLLKNAVCNYPAVHLIVDRATANGTRKLNSMDTWMAQFQRNEQGKVWRRSA